ncbi:MAG: metal-dependent hydrolase [Candidatus Acidiferrales bacterium]|jgi:L-ascorbate metabolism protein UlaG (beta-lactamase superfamily)
MLRTHGNKITWLGHASFALTTPSGSVILIDPWLTGNPVCPPALKKPARVDAILITHGHGDHFGDVLPLARTHKPKIAAIYETAMWLQSEGIENVMPMSKGGTQKVGDVEVTMVNAFHSNGIESGQPGEPVIYGGEAAGFIVRMPEGLTIYHAGDTCVFGDMRIIGELYRPEVACLPIGDLYTMGPREAAYAIRLLGVHHVIPMHYGTFPALTGTPEALRADTKDIAELEIHALKPGESLG